MLQQRLTLGEIAKLYQWGYHKTYRFWKDDPRTHVDYKPDPTKAPKMSYKRKGQHNGGRQQRPAA
jgi:hypothetical protein